MLESSLQYPIHTICKPGVAIVAIASICLSACLSMCMPVLYVCVCVNHLKRCKASNLLEFRYSVLSFDFISLRFRFAGGQSHVCS